MQGYNSVFALLIILVDVKMQLLAQCVAIILLLSASYAYAFRTSNVKLSGGVKSSSDRLYRGTFAMQRFQSNQDSEQLLHSDDFLKTQRQYQKKKQFPSQLKNSPIVLSTMVMTAILTFCFPSISSAANLESFASILNLNNIDGGFLQSFLLIFISEIGDKTFFIAALLSAKYGKAIAFTGSMLALGSMTLISTALGQLFHAVPSSLTQGLPLDDYLAVLAFAYFGVKTLLEASKMSDDKNESTKTGSEMSGMEEEKLEAEELVNQISSKNNNNANAAVLTLIAQTFSLVFAAEIGDRSFLSTIALSAALNPVLTCLGALFAHASATGIAVLGGSIMSKYLSEKVIGYIGGSLFLIFAVTTAFGLF